MLESPREKIAEWLWYLQGTKVAQRALGRTEMPIRTGLIAARRVIKEEQNLSYGDWTLIRQFTEQMLLNLGYDKEKLDIYAVLVTSTVEQLNGDPSVQLSRLELEGKHGKQDIHKISPLWRK